MNKFNVFFLFLLLGGYNPLHVYSFSLFSQKSSSLLKPASSISSLVCQLQMDNERNERISSIIPPLTYSLYGDIKDHQIKKKPIFGHFVSWIVKRLVEAKTQSVTGLEVNVLSPNNRDILRGKVNTLELKFDSLVYGQLFVSGILIFFNV